LARFSNSTLVALGGLDRNILIDEILYKESKYYDISWLADTQRTVTQQTGTTVTFSPANASVFTLNGYVSFGNNSTLYKIVGIANNNQLTLETAPLTPLLGGTAIQVPVDITSADITFRLLEHTADVNDDTRAGVDISNIVAKPGASELNLDVNVVTNVSTMSTELGQMRLLINADDLSSTQPVIDSTSPPIYLGYISILLPQTDPNTPRQVKKQRIALICRSDGITG
jgi:hypothetical protein